MGSGLADFGGKRRVGETEWEAASRECEEECGLKLGRQTLDCVVDPVRHAQRSHTVFLVHDTRTPQPRSEILAVRHVKWDEIDISKYHPRLKYDYGGQLRQQLAEAKASVHSDRHLAMWGVPEPTDNG